MVEISNDIVSSLNISHKLRHSKGHKLEPHDSIHILSDYLTRDGTFARRKRILRTFSYLSSCLTLCDIFKINAARLSNHSTASASGSIYDS